MKNLKHFMKPKTSSKVKKTTPKKQEVLPTTVNTLFYQGLFPNGLMQVSPDYFSQSYLLGDVNYQTVGLEDKGAMVEKYSDLINSLDDKTNFQLTIFNKKVNLEQFRKSVLYPLHEDGFDPYREEFNRMMDANLEAGKNNFSAIK
ncbi:AAA family ATPase, partial [Streptococcus anginosus]